MTIRIRGKSARRLLKSLQLAQLSTLAAGVGLLLWPLFVSAESVWAQWAGERELAAVKRSAQETIVPRESKIPASPSRPRRGSVLGRFEIPRLHLSYVVLEGTDNRTLDKSIGHVAGTAGIGEKGNIGIAGHRNTHFRKLEWIRRGDEIVLSSAQGEFRYQVEWAKLYSPEDMEVLSPAHGPAVTLVTCFPFEYVGSAPLRFIVRALPDVETRARISGNAASSQAVKPADE
jgi:LPXTG-site transpeptidase (sortase) family protein